MILSIIKLIDGSEIIGELVSHNGDRYSIRTPFNIITIDTEETKSFILKPVSKFIVDHTIQISESKVMIHPYEVENPIVLDSYLEHIKFYSNVLSNTLISINNQTKTLKNQEEVKRILESKDILKISLLMTPMESISLN